MKRTLVIVLISALIILVPAGLIYYQIQSNYQFSHQGSVILDEPINSPNNKYTAHISYQYYGGAAGGVNIIVNIEDHTNNNELNTVYFSDAKNNIHVNWINDAQLLINNKNHYTDHSTTLVIGEEIFDGSGKACRMLNIKKTYTCKTDN